MNNARAGIREYRAIPLSDLPKVLITPGGVRKRAATDDELLQMDIHMIHRGTTNALAICNGYLNRETKQSEDAHGNPWPGEVLEGKPGMYREQRQQLIEANLKAYKGGNSAGRKKLMQDKRPEEFDRPDGDGGTIPAEILTESERLFRALPRIMGDG